jgi:hypothetical protein
VGGVGGGGGGGGGGGVGVGVITKRDSVTLVTDFE